MGNRGYRDDYKENRSRIAWGTGAGALGGAALGAKLGAVAGPIGMGIGATIGAGAGFLYQRHQVRKDADKHRELDRIHREEDRRLAYNSGLHELSMFDTGGTRMEGLYDVGGLIRLSNDAVEVQGNTHEAGGEDYFGANVEDGEVMKQSEDGVQVFSEQDGYADLVKPLLLQKNQLEQEYLKVVNKVDFHLDNTMKSTDKYIQAGNERKVLAYEKRAEMLQGAISSIEATIQQIFQEQQQGNNHHGEEMGGQPMMADSMQEPMQEGMPMDMGEDQFMAKGGKIKADVGAFLANNQNVIGDSLFAGFNFASNMATIKGYENQMKHIPKRPEEKAFVFRDDSTQSARLAQVSDSLSKYVPESNNPTTRQALKTAVRLGGERIKSGIRETAHNNRQSIKQLNLANIQDTFNKNLQNKFADSRDRFNYASNIRDMKSATRGQLGRDVLTVFDNQSARKMDKARLAIEGMKGYDGEMDAIKEVLKELGILR